MQNTYPGSRTSSAMASTPARPARELPQWASALTHYMDDAVRIPGTRITIGLDSIIGFLLPGVGDVLTGTSSIALLLLAFHIGVPRVVLLRMVINVGIDSLVGAIPLVGDLFDVAWKANRRNLELIRRHQQTRSRATFGDYAVVGLAVVVLLALLALPLVLLGAVIAWLT